MKQQHFQYDNKQQFSKQMLELKNQLENCNNYFFQIFSDDVREEIFIDVTKILDKIFTDALYFGCTNCENIVNC